MQCIDIIIMSRLQEKIKVLIYLRNHFCVIYKISKTQLDTIYMTKDWITILYLLLNVNNFSFIVTFQHMSASSDPVSTYKDGSSVTLRPCSYKLSQGIMLKNTPDSILWLQRIWCF